MKVYQISGLGAGEEVFSRIKLDVETQFIPWLMPESLDEPLEHYARRMAAEINSSEEFSLMGVSFGGMMCQEIARFLNPKHIFLISSASSSREVPFPIQWTAKLGLNKKIPDFNQGKIKKGLYFMFGAQSERDRKMLDQIIDNLDLDYLRWSTTQVGLWRQGKKMDNVIRFHGKKDLLFPKFLLNSVDHWIEGGHMASVHDGPNLSKLINHYLIKGV